MNNIEELLLLAAIVKLSRGEFLTIKDVERILDLITRSNWQIEIVDQQTLANLQLRIRSILAKKFNLSAEGGK